jgi:uncharacterized protein YndB with AHSA1/START domain
MTFSPSDKLEVTTPSDLEIVMTRRFPASKALVFDAFTRPEHLRRWLGRPQDTMSLCEVDLRVGGAWRFRWQLVEGGEPDGTDDRLDLPEDALDGLDSMGMYGEFLEIAPPDRLVQTEIFEEPFFEVMGGGSVNTMVLEERDGVTTMTLTALYKSKAARDRVLQTPMEEGAAMSFDQLEALLLEEAQ